MLYSDNGVTHNYNAKDVGTVALDEFGLKCL